jgi:hypothetical protein
LKHFRTNHHILIYRTSTSSISRKTRGSANRPRRTALAFCIRQTDPESSVPIERSCNMLTNMQVTFSACVSDATLKIGTAARRETQFQAPAPSQRPFMHVQRCLKNSLKITCASRRTDAQAGTQNRSSQTSSRNPKLRYPLSRHPARIPARW